MKRSIAGISNTLPTQSVSAVCVTLKFEENKYFLLKNKVFIQYLAKKEPWKPFTWQNRNIIDKICGLQGLFSFNLRPAVWFWVWDPCYIGCLSLQTVWGPFVLFWILPCRSATQVLRSSLKVEKFFLHWHSQSELPRKRSASFEPPPSQNEAPHSVEKK